MSPRDPVAFDFDPAAPGHVREGGLPAGQIVIDDAPFDAAEPPLPATRRGFPWGRLALAAAGFLVSLSVGLWVDQLVRDLFARQDWLGWLALAGVAAAGIGVVGLVGREAAALLRLARIDRLRERAAAAVTDGDAAAALAIGDDVSALYADRPDLGAARAAHAARTGDVIDARDRLVLTEADLLAPLDIAATRIVADAARRVSVVTAVSPRAAIDVLFVLVAAAGLVGRIGRLYGGRPGVLGFVRLTRLVIAHLAVTGSIAIGDGIVQQIVGHGLAARLSARLGEGVINGLLTARIGLAAIDVCRPLPFLDRSRPKIADVMQGVASTGPGRAPRAGDLSDG